MTRSSADHHTLVRLLTAGADAHASANAIDGVRDWSSLASLASRHGLGAMVHRAAITASAPVPREVLDEWEAQRSLEAAWYRELATLAAEASEALSVQGIANAVLKGPALADRLYAVPADRVSTDLDLLVESHALEDAIEALRTLDFADRDNATEDWHRTHHHHLTLDRADGVVIEIHFRAFTGFGAEVPSEPLLARSRRHMMRSGHEVGVLDPDDEWLYLVAHAAGHLFERLSWVRDLQLFAEQLATVHGDAVAMRAEEFGLTRAIEFGAMYLAQFGIPSPVATRARSARDRIAAATLAATQRAPNGPPKQVGTMIFTGLLANDPIRAGRLVVRDATRITRRRLQRYFPTVFPERWAG